MIIIRKHRTPTSAHVPAYIIVSVGQFPNVWKKKYKLLSSLQFMLYTITNVGKYFK